MRIAVIFGEKHENCLQRGFDPGTSPAAVRHANHQTTATSNNESSLGSKVTNRISVDSPITKIRGIGSQASGGYRSRRNALDDVAGSRHNRITSEAPTMRRDGSKASASCRARFGLFARRINRRRHAGGWRVDMWSSRARLVLGRTGEFERRNGFRLSGDDRLLCRRESRLFAGTVLNISTFPDVIGQCSRWCPTTIDSSRRVKQRLRRS